VAESSDSNRGGPAPEVRLDAQGIVHVVPAGRVTLSDMQAVHARRCALGEGPRPLLVDASEVEGVDAAALDFALGGDMAPLTRALGIVSASVLSRSLVRLYLARRADLPFSVAVFGRVGEAADWLRGFAAPAEGSES